MAEPSVTWYANGARAVVTTAGGEQWWIAPDGFGEYSAVPQEGQDGLRPRQGATLEELLRGLLGDTADQFLAGAPR